MCFHEVPHFKYNKSKYMPYQTTLLVDQSLSTKKELSDRDWFQVGRVGRPLFILVKNDPHWTEAPKRWFRMTDELHLSFSYYQQHDERPHQFSSFSKHAWLSYDLVKNAKIFWLTRYISRVTQLYLYSSGLITTGALAIASAWSQKHFYVINMLMLE